MARRPNQTLRTNKALARDTLSDLGLHRGAGDENRTRTISLGICEVGTPDVLSRR
jgi:hypothetical protein